MGYVEAKENETKHDNVKLRDVIKTNFEAIYTICYNAVKQDDELMDKNGLDMSGLCLERLEEHYKEEMYFESDAEDTFDDSDDDDDTDDSITYDNNYYNNY